MVDVDPRDLLERFRVDWPHEFEQTRLRAVVDVLTGENERLRAENEQLRAQHDPGQVSTPLYRATAVPHHNDPDQR